LARHERSALAVKQAQLSSEIASLQAKVEEVRQVHVPELSSYRFHHSAGLFE
jgi:hypothetical protein